ncbi:SxtJ family membrane protein [Dyadobacter sp. CY261]|uniref:SxtJ family membrane protein n=1 Tax=Dyadobacter sp. CY261 TaxID=2907203 RepID=UPI001F2AAD6B|nr:SxtJ family membrane protein [Dyadobacter sp. CY261]MCF0070334.1 SxtJ family membrane protein [Dyadobacter sp. CY261]
MSESEKVKAQLVIVTGLVVLYFIFKSQYPYLLIAAAAIGVLSIAIPVFGDLIVKLWYKIAEVLGAINGKILLSVVFFVVLFPVALLARLTKKNPLHLKKEDSNTVFTERNHKYSAKDLEQVW